jgi:hypothetical protein
MTTGSQTIYVVVLGDTLPPILRTLNTYFLSGKLPEIFFNRFCKLSFSKVKVITFLVCFLVIFPLTCLKSLDALKYPRFKEIL